MRSFHRAMVPIYLLVAAALPQASSAGQPDAGRALADRLRHGPGIINHPVGVAPSSEVRIPDGWPLRNDGAITCLTCHRQLPKLDGTGEQYLRRVDAGRAGTGFCATCHAQGGASARPAMHWMALERAHVRAPATLASFSPQNGKLDALSSRCVNCHDGVTAAEASHRVAGSGASSSDNGSHPIGMPYLAGSAGQRTAPLRHPRELPDAVLLPDGRVGCVSCHNLFSSAPYRLSVPIEGSRLCLTCHAME